MACTVVDEALRSGAGTDGNVEVVLGDVDTGARCCGRAHLFHALCLSSGPGRPGIRSGHKEKKERRHREARTASGDVPFRAELGPENADRSLAALTGLGGTGEGLLW